LQPHERLKVQVAGGACGHRKPCFSSITPENSTGKEGFVHRFVRSPYVCAMASILTYNVNGLRSALSKGWDQWIGTVAPDIVCLQEIKMMPDQLPSGTLERIGYGAYWFPAEKKGYSGVAILSRKEPDRVVYGMDDPSDMEGRVIRADFGDWSVLSVYVPSGTTGEERQSFKMDWLERFDGFLVKLRKKRPNLIVCGDFNICHKAIDIHDPVRNATSSGFLPEERAWMDRFTGKGWIDSFRHFSDSKDEYTWWSFRAGSRSKNKGWRLDYQFVTDPLASSLKRCVHLQQAVHSDHCPVLLETSLK
jgi:exodeoxyribonuclease-3